MAANSWTLKAMTPKIRIPIFHWKVRCCELENNSLYLPFVSHPVIFSLSIFRIMCFDLINLSLKMEKGKAHMTHGTLQPLFWLVSTPVNLPYYIITTSSITPHFGDNCLISCIILRILPFCAAI